MFCPDCRMEYRKGFLYCSDCNVRLVEKLPPEEVEEFVEYVKVLWTFNPMDIAFIKSLLDSEDITYFFKGEYFNYVRPMADPAILMVREDQAETVKELLKDANLSFMASSLPDRPETDEEERTG